MGFLERLFGYKEEPADKHKASPYGARGQEQQRPPDADEQALERYRYMIKTAPPEAIEQAHEEAFAKLTPAQRAQALRELAATPERARAALARSADDPKSLARLATRAEMRQPGVMERTFGGLGGRGGPGMGMAGTIFGSLVAGFVGSMVAQQFLESMDDDFGFGEDETSELSGDEVAAAAEEGSGDYGWGDYGSGDFGDFGGDFGGDF